MTPLGNDEYAIDLGKLLVGFEEAARLYYNDLCDTSLIDHSDLNSRFMKMFSKYGHLSM